jgi:O-antigen chain-terminating methyltransferase
VSDQAPELDALEQRAEEQDAAYAAALDALDALASFALPEESLPEQPEQLERLNESWHAPTAPAGAGLWGPLQRKSWEALAPFITQQTTFNAAVVQILNGHLQESARLAAHLRALAVALIRYVQRLLPLIDARDRLSSGLSTARAELILEAFDRRQESLARRIDGLAALRDRLETLSAEVGALRAALAETAPSPALAETALRAAEDSRYVAFENRFRGSRDELREKLAGYVTLFDGAPVLDLGCGRGEFLELLAEAGVAARGVESNAHVARECRERGLDVTDGDLLAFLRQQPADSVGGVFAAQVAEHLPPAVLHEMLREGHRVLRPRGRLVLETVNPRSLVGFLEVYNRDLTHERPLHPDTLSFMAAAAGFTDVRIELRSPVEPAARLQPVPADGLPEPAARALNENVARLNDLLYAPQEYVLIARR